MTETGFPFDSGAGANVMENQWSLMARHWLQTGVIRNELNGLQIYADSSGMQVKVKSGMAMMQGHFYQNDAEVVLPISSADATYTRIDRIILRLDWTANTIKLTVLQGTPGATPSAPALTQNTSIWEISLAQINVAANASTIAAGNVTDERTFATALIDNATVFPNSIATNGYQKLPNGLIIQWGMASNVPTGGTGLNVNFPISFPNNFWMAVATAAGTSGSATLTPNTLGNMTVYQSSGTTLSVYWIAIGS